MVRRENNWATKACRWVLCYYNLLIMALTDMTYEFHQARSTDRVVGLYTQSQPAQGPCGFYLLVESTWEPAQLLPTTCEAFLSRTRRRSIEFYFQHPIALRGTENVLFWIFVASTQGRIVYPTYCPSSYFGSIQVLVATSVMTALDSCATAL